MGCCSVCGDYEEMDYTCNYCGKTHCVTHRLPESHDCSALTNFGQISKHLQSDTDAKLKGEHEEDRQSEAQSEPDESSKPSNEGNKRESSATTNSEDAEKRNKVADLLSKDSKRATASSTKSREKHGPKPIEEVRTYGGSGRDRENANFPGSPDVNPDGSLADSEVEPIEHNYGDDDKTKSRIWDHLNEYIWTYGVLAAILLILQFGFGIDVLSLLGEYLPGL